MSVESVMPSNHLILCHPLLLVVSIFPRIKVFSNESVLHIRWPKYWSFSFNISPSNKYSELISFRMDLLDLLAVQGTRKSLLQHQSSKASILQCSAFFIVQFSHPYMTTGKTIPLTKWTFVGKVISLLFNMLSRLVIGFLPRSKCLHFMAAITICSDFGAQKNKVSHCFHCFPIYLPWSDGTRCHILALWMLSFTLTFSLSSFTFIKRLFSSCSFSYIKVWASSFICKQDSSIGADSFQSEKKQQQQPCTLEYLCFIFGQEKLEAWQWDSRKCWGSYHQKGTVKASPSSLMSVVACSHNHSRLLTQSFIHKHDSSEIGFLSKSDKRNLQTPN